MWRTLVIFRLQKMFFSADYPKTDNVIFQSLNHVGNRDKLEVMVFNQKWLIYFTWSLYCLTGSIIYYLENFFLNLLAEKKRNVERFFVYFRTGRNSAMQLRSSICPLTGFFWLLSHLIYLKLTKV